MKLINSTMLKFKLQFLFLATWQTTDTEKKFPGTVIVNMLNKIITEADQENS